MTDTSHLFSLAIEKYRTWYGRSPSVAAYAPGRVEILGNHTDYNEGFVLSAAISFGTYFLCSRAPASGGGQDAVHGPTGTAPTCRLVAGDLMEEAVFTIPDAEPYTDHSWPNYVMGVAMGLHARGLLREAFNGLFYGNVPIGSGLSSSAALEMCTGTALAALSGATVEPIEMAKIGQAAEHDYVGAKTGLMDQITSLFGRRDCLVRSDFRTLDVETIDLPGDVRFLVIDTEAKHSHGESDYNNRRSACERAVVALRDAGERSVAALRDVSMDVLKARRTVMDEEAWKRAAHVVGENERVMKGRLLLDGNDLGAFGRLMYESHESSRTLFENSCPELDAVVDSARRQPEALGARLSGGGFGGSAVVMVRPNDTKRVSERICEDFAREFGRRPSAHVIEASDGASVVPLPTDKRSGGSGSDSHGLPGV